MIEDDKPEPADSEVLPWVVVAFIAFMLLLMTLRSCVG